MKESNVICAHEGCDCSIPPKAVSKDGPSYCSDACGEGRGCDHPDCNCGAKERADEPARAPEPIVAS
jgi:hypothetical protein